MGFHYILNPPRTACLCVWEDNPRALALWIIAGSQAMPYNNLLIARAYICTLGKKIFDFKHWNINEKRNNCLCRKERKLGFC